MEHSARIQQLLADKKKLFTDLNDEVWGYAEPRFAEYKSAAAHCRLMEAEGFRVKLGLAGEETAFVAEYGSGKPVIAILGEYDALAGLSQEADCTEPKPVEAGGQGHGCGHNTLGAAGAAAITVLKDYMEENNLPGTIRF
jgi:aminobenzoyl-glutamate utilization protein B